MYRCLKRYNCMQRLNKKQKQQYDYHALANIN